MDDKNILQSVEGNTDLISQYAKEAEQKALEAIASRFEDSSKPFDRLYFHDTDHTRGLLTRGERLIDSFSREGILLTAKDRALMRIACAFHDIVQDYTMIETSIFIADPDATGLNDKYKKVENGVVVPENAPAFTFHKRARAVGKNEEKSAEIAVEFMQEANKKAGQEVFSARDIFVVKAGILSTVPTFEPTQISTHEGEKRIFGVKQNKLSEYVDLYKSQTTVPDIGRPIDISDLAVIASTAIADLGTAGMEGAYSSIIDGDKLLLEDYPELGQEIMEGNQVIPEEFRPYFSKMILDWGKIQIDFPHGLSANLTSGLAGISEGMSRALNCELQKDNYNEGSITSAAILATRETMSWEELKLDMQSIVNTKNYLISA